MAASLKRSYCLSVGTEIFHNFRTDISKIMSAPVVVGGPIFNEIYKRAKSNVISELVLYVYLSANNISRVAVLIWHRDPHKSCEPRGFWVLQYLQYCRPRFPKKLLFQGVTIGNRAWT